ncbi:class I SAM-dependent methyltransferase [Alteromonas ponticola]|uniref:Class I SAM-dependent methyltransferase n=1 Tax=Alteromonas aquimaris TaxID=2998417 RepID=A0ABT3P384_9ALTE|nr:class I SAM-dependent methyltransferase [Alteromonas aquimaris]MCW8107224.1 class I SAM-dependent methyltransferase [Alteromonas aquimaris]
MPSQVTIRRLTASPAESGAIVVSMFLILLNEISTPNVNEWVIIQFQRGYLRNASVRDLKIIENSKVESLLLADYVRKHFSNLDHLSILEAGCGQSWALDLNGTDYTLTGIDVDEDALALRMQNSGDLNTAIVGDLRVLDLPAQQFDLIYNAFVLEHIENAVQVLNNFDRWLKPNGLLILKIPDRDSVYGFLARHSPHWSHIFYYRHVKQCENAGKPGFAPYPVVYDDCISRAGIRDYCKRNNLELVTELGKNNYIKKRRLSSLMVKYSAMLISLLSLGYLAWQHNDLVFVIRKKSTDTNLNRHHAF